MLSQEQFLTQFNRLYLMNRGNWLNQDGYPADNALDLIKSWPVEDSQGLFDFIKELWHLSDRGWHEKEEPHEYRPNVIVKKYIISTAGFSGNESIIHHMKLNEVFWSLTWVQSRRGGHYIFEHSIK